MQTDDRPDCAGIANRTEVFVDGDVKGSEFLRKATAFATLNELPCR
jgi:hypothetical protein